MSNSYIRALTPEDWEVFRAKRLEALREVPTAFGMSCEEEEHRSDEEWRAWLAAMQGQSFVLGAFVEETLVGMMGLHNAERVKTRHRANVWGVYVSLEWRGYGIARQMMSELLHRARLMKHLRFVHLTVVIDQIAARKLYESYGFRVYGYERGALCVEGVLYDEVYMSLELPE